MKKKQQNNPIVNIPKIMRVLQGTAFSTGLYKNDVTDRHTSFFYSLLPW